MHDADARATMHLGLRRLESLVGRRLVTARDGSFYGLDIGPHAAET